MMHGHTYIKFMISPHTNNTAYFATHTWTRPDFLKETS